jgi:hypothetical protein
VNNIFAKITLVIDRSKPPVIIPIYGFQVLLITGPCIIIRGFYPRVYLENVIRVL